MKYLYYIYHIIRITFIISYYMYVPFDKIFFSINIFIYILLESIRKKYLIKLDVHTNIV